MKDFIALFNQYPNLSKHKVSLTDLGVAHRVFFNWKDKGIIDYEHHFTEEDIANNVTRKKIELNAFEALWVLLIKELRLFNIGLNIIGELRSYLFSPHDFNPIKELSQETIDSIAAVGLPRDQHSFLSALELDIPGLVDVIEKIPKSNAMYFSPIGTIVNAILISGHSPTLFIYKKPLEDKLSFEIFNPTLEDLYHRDRDEDYRTEVINGLVGHSVINIPLRPLFEQFFENKSLLKHAKGFDLFNKEELKILNILKSSDFDKIIIQKNNNKQLVIESSSSSEILGNAALELKKTLGFNDYKSIQITRRNDKHFIVNKTKKEKIDLADS